MNGVAASILAARGQDTLADLEGLPHRGSRPRTPGTLPYLQLDDWPPGGMVVRLHQWAGSLPDVVVRQSRMASPQTLALCLAEEKIGGPAEAFIDGAEFCHLHPLPGGSLHLTLPEPVRARAIELCWAETHPVALSSKLSRYLVLVYAPRDEKEFAVVTTLVGASWRFARGGL